MRAGRLRHKVDLYTPTTHISDLGEIETVNQLVGTFYADVVGRTSSEASNDGTMVSETSYTVYLRYNSTDLTDVNPSSYLAFEGRILNVKSVALRDHRRRVVEVTAEEAR